MVYLSTRSNHSVSFSSALVANRKTLARRLHPTPGILLPDDVTGQEEWSLQFAAVQDERGRRLDAMVWPKTRGLFVCAEP
jgi:hypothetical protein